MRKPQQAFTVFEALIVLAIVGILATIALYPWYYERGKFARNNLRLAWQSEKDFYAFSFKGTQDMLGGSSETYTTDWDKLFCKNLNTRDPHFQYSIEEATSTTLKIKATDRKNPGHFFIIDQDGKIADETGRAYIINAEGKEEIR